MKTQHRYTPARRDLALNRLGQLTARIAFAGFAAVGGLGYLAALHNAGTSATSGAVAATVTGSTTTTNDSTAGVSDSTQSSTSSSSSPQASPSGVSSSSGSGQVTTGGS
jgi:hypothetical protein